MPPREESFGTTRARLSQAEHHFLYDQLVDPETYLLCGMKKRNGELEDEKEVAPSHKLAVISGTNFTNQPARALSEFFWRMLKRDAENAEVKVYIISQFREVGGPDT